VVPRQRVHPTIAAIPLFCRINPAKGGNDPTYDSVQRYEVNLNRVLFCLEKGLNIEESSFVTKISKNLVIEYQNIAKGIDQAKREQGDIDFDDLPF
jgi:hypothetical protein